MVPAAMRVPCVGLPQLAPHLAHGMEDAEHRPDAPQFVGEPRAAVLMPDKLFEVAAFISRARVKAQPLACNRSRPPRRPRRVQSLPPAPVGNPTYPRAIAPGSRVLS